MVRVLIADDHPIVRTGLRQILVDEPDIEVAGEAQNGGEVIDFLWKNACDLVLLDIGMPGRSGLEIISEIRQIKPNVGILILSIYPEEQYAVRALRAGASGYLTKASAPVELIQAIHRVSRAEDMSARRWPRSWHRRSTGTAPNSRMKSSRTGSIRSCSFWLRARP